MVRLVLNASHLTGDFAVMTSLNSFIFIAESNVVPKVHEGHEFFVSENALPGCAIRGSDSDRLGSRRL